ncbi:MAG: ABC transporter permease [Christensenellales bacterium]|jgi:NitT/TauT family transport system permease protein
MSTKALKNAVSRQHEDYIRKQLNRKRLVQISRWGFLLAFILLWEVAARLGWIDAFIFSSPTRMWNTFNNLLAEGKLWMHLGTSVWETVLGFLLGTLIGSGVAVALWWWKGLADVLEPYLIVLNSLPKVALGPIIIVWVGAGMGAIITMALLISVIITIISVWAGFNEVAQDRIDLMRSFNASKAQIFFKVVLPANIPTIISSLKINVGMSWVGVIMGEFLVSKAGIGYLIVYGGQVFQLDLVMTCTVLLCIAAAIMYLAVAYLEKKVRWIV